MIDSPSPITIPVEKYSKSASSSRAWLGWRAFVRFIFFLAGAFLIALLIFELKTSWLQARYLSKIAHRLTYKLGPGPSPSIQFPQTGPYDQRLGYATLGKYLNKLTDNDYTIQTQARFSPLLYDLTEKGLFTIYHEKDQAGLCIKDREDQMLFSFHYPGRIYQDFNSIPDLVVKTLLFIENRELLDPKYPYRNPVVEWDRLAKAAFDMTVHAVSNDHDVAGGSTLATQIEKYKHSPRGLTSSPLEKLRQMLSGSLRIYLDGKVTLGAQRQVILKYINSIPLAAIPGYGEVNSLGDGLWAWYGTDFEAANKNLLSYQQRDRRPALSELALLYKQVLSLFLAQRRPSFYLVEDQEALKILTNEYLPILASAGLISNNLCQAALKTELTLRHNIPPQPCLPFPELKTADIIRNHLLKLLDVPQFYDLDRLDLTVKSTLDSAVQNEVVKTLRQLQDPNFAKASGILGFRLLSEGNDLSKVVYSFTLYEHVDEANLIRVQADSYDQPFNINEGVKLELGSTAKLRTLITYLEIIGSLHQHYAHLSPKELSAVQIPGSDRLSHWAIQYLSNTSNKGLLPMLEAAMQRSYSASPAEAFFTGGGRHSFVNFDKIHDHQVMTIHHALINSVNLVFIRLMRDIVRYYMFQVPGSTAKILEDVQDPSRKVYLSRFADHEGRIFMNRFYRKYEGKSPQEALDLLLKGVLFIPSRLATVFRSVTPEADFKEFSSFMISHLPNSKLDDDDLQRLYQKYSPSSFNLADRGYITRTHPLELWLVAYLRQHPGASRTEVIEASTDERQAVYAWLFKTRGKHAQDIRIRTLLEIEAFQEIYKSWKRLGYPFDFLVPSYATAIGSSADRPASLTELMGIILNNGIRYPSLRIHQLHFAEGTPYETILENERLKKGGEQIILPEIAAVAKKALLDVTELGTAGRVRRAFSRPDQSFVAVGGKTGTGDNRHHIFSARGKIIESKVINRTATFVFFIGDRFFGTITAYVPGPEASHYKFTSSLPVQILKVLAPKLMPMIENSTTPT